MNAETVKVGDTVTTLFRHNRYCVDQKEMTRTRVWFRVSNLDDGSSHEWELKRTDQLIPIS